MSQTSRNYCTRSHLVRWPALLVCIALWPSFETSQGVGAIVFIEPGDAKEGLPARSLEAKWVRGGLRLSFGTPGILQSAADLQGAEWGGVGLVSPYIVPEQEVLDRRFFRVLSAERPVQIRVPANYDPVDPIPLVVLLHGFSDTGQGLEDYTHILPLAEEYGFAFCYPDGTLNTYGHHFWNASPACCDFLNSGVDDVTYLRTLIEDAQQRINIDPKRVFLIGYSNGAFMAHRMAQEHSDLVAAIACLAGTITLGDTSVPTEPVHVLQVHGTADTVIRYGGGTASLSFPGGISYQGAAEYIAAQAVVEWWGTVNACANWVAADDPTLELSTDFGNPDTRVDRYAEPTPGGEVELWSIQGANHWPNPQPDFWRLMIEWLLAHPKH